jgi:hypothetical protein
VNPGSIPAFTSGSSASHWPQWMTTWSPTDGLVTPSPTAHTTPEASLPPMWKSVGSPNRPCTWVTSTGIPLAAHTLL